MASGLMGSSGGRVFAAGIGSDGIVSTMIRHTGNTAKLGVKVGKGDAAEAVDVMI